MMANLFGALAVGIVGSILARYKRMPVIIFNIPGLVPLVPGGTAYRAVRNLVLGNISQAVTQSISVIMVAGAIAVGFMFAQILADITRKRSSVPIWLSRH
ncbi:threonine/serine exporter family protein [Latilactobacillus sakei]|nr:threonine/serine exporter family protein [Latilactobacillus sakei]